MSTALRTRNGTLPNPRHIGAFADDSSRRRTIVLLGIDGAGKTTAAESLVKVLKLSGTPAQLLRNPAGRRWLSRVAERFGTSLSPSWANRIESVVRCVNVLRAHLKATTFHGTTVMDRHIACQLVLQSVRGLPRGHVLPWLIARLPRPEAIVLLDLPAELAQARIILRGEDSETLLYLESAREAYLRIAQDKGWHIIDGSADPEQVLSNIARVVSRAS
ncbi:MULTISPECIES: dTMP kinase [Paeniglutamicibacter]|uniref:Thymidylate kinase n=1 Tax=Paeniglutamicibacter terrestris TaxID=2723403 RepID=A0ABX1G461_9MICC|nr:MULTISPECIES: dTMP kinase [Paeniglutamicibacter]ASN40640.1 thymidylate kinase [Arthrobacter sp. 7749]NKG21036.1 thymidylate kinase [Paeniglutamicibacter terrestris]QXQ10642.1 thymidylate kinase [Paeniglutamicibacter sp. Y32M11]